MVIEFLFYQKNTDIKAYYYVSTHFAGLDFNSFWFKAENKFRYATPEEIEELNTKLAAEGKRWNPDTMQIEKLRWKPLCGDAYYVIDLSPINMSIKTHRWVDDRIDIGYYKTNNCFKTGEEAEAKLEQIKKLLLEG